jgi:hypothetical protein
MKAEERINSLKLKFVKILKISGSFSNKTHQNQIYTASDSGMIYRSHLFLIGLAWKLLTEVDVAVDYQLQLVSVLSPSMTS